MIAQEDVIRGLLADRAKLLAYIRSIVLSPHAAEDIHQDVVVLAIKKADTICDAKHLLAWARHVARLKAIDYLRGARKQPRHVDPDVLDLLEPTWDEETTVSSPSMINALHECLQELSPRSRRIVDLRYGKKLKGEQVSRLTGLKLQSVYMALSRIYRTLADCVRRKAMYEG